MNQAIEFAIVRLKDRQAGWAQRRRLENELAGYHTEADLRDFEAILERYPDEQTLDIRRILSAQRLQSS